MKSNKIIILLVAALTMATSVGAQVHNSYFMFGSAERYHLNPALSPTRGYFAIPVAGINVNMESNFLSVENFFFPNKAENSLVTYMHSSVSAEEFLKSLPDNNRLDFNLNDRLLSIGNYFRGGFWSIELRLRSETSVNIPKDFFALTKTLATGTYNLSGFGIKTNNFVEASLGYTFPVQDVFTLGFRGKALVGLAHLTANLDQVNIAVGTEEYTADLSGTIQANIAGYDFEGLTGEISFGDLIEYATDFSHFSPSNISSIGFAFDAGIEWLFMDEQVRFSAAITDFGHISWSPRNSYTGSVENVGFAFKGYDIESNEILFEKPENIALKSSEENFGSKNKLHANYIAGLEYNFLNDVVGLGVMWSGKQLDSELYQQATVAATIRPTTWLSATISESFLDNQIGVLGAALNIHTSFVNLFVGVDYIGSKFGTAKGGKIPVPLNTQSSNITFGLSIPLGIKMF